MATDVNTDEAAQKAAKDYYHFGMPESAMRQFAQGKWDEDPGEVLDFLSAGPNDVSHYRHLMGNARLLNEPTEGNETMCGIVEIWKATYTLLAMQSNPLADGETQKRLENFKVSLQMTEVSSSENPVNAAFIDVSMDTAKNMDRDREDLNELLMGIMKETPPESERRVEAQKWGSRGLASLSRARNASELVQARLTEELQDAQAAMRANLRVPIMEVLVSSMDEVNARVVPKTAEESGTGSKGHKEATPQTTRKNHRGMRSKERREHKVRALRNCVLKVIQDFPEDIKTRTGKYSATKIYETMRYEKSPGYWPEGFEKPSSPGRWIRDIKIILSELGK